MKRLLLLLLVVFPVVLFAQKRQKAIIDSIKAASTSLQSVSAAINNYPGTEVENIRASDSDGYVTLVVRVRVTEHIVAPISPLPAAKIKTRDRTASKLTPVEVPPLPPIPVEVDTILPLPALATFELKTGNVLFAKLDVVTLPSLPHVKEEIDAMLFLAVFRLKTGDIHIGKMDVVTPPTLPHVREDIEVISPLAVSALRIEYILVPKLDAVTLPPLPHVREDIEVMSLLAVSELRIGYALAVKLDAVPLPPLPIVKEEVDALFPLAAIGFRIDAIAVVKLAITATVPDLPEIDPETFVPIAAVIRLPIQDLPASKVDIVALPDFEEKEMSVADMHLSDEGYALLEKMEGFSPELYTLKDGGFTIGFGFFVPYGEVSKWRNGVTREEAERLIRQKMPAYENQVKQYINVPLIQEEFDALTMLAYNLGGFSRATSIVNDINTNAGFEKLQSDWMRFVHSKAPGVMNGLMNRRKDELQVRRESNYQPERKILIFRNRK